MNHKRHRPKKRRAGCLYCKPHKTNSAPRGGETDKQYAAKKDAMKDVKNAVQNMFLLQNQAY
jgi:hypothetical protein